MVASSVWLGTNTSTSASSDIGRVPTGAGAGLSYGAAGGGSSCGSSVERDLELQKGDGGGIEDGAAASMSARATRPFAPGLTTVALSPSAPTEINATPLGISAVVRR